MSAFSIVAKVLTFNFAVSTVSVTITFFPTVVLPYTSRSP